MISAITKSLLDTRNSDGAWGTYADRPTNTEATAFALMGLAATDAEAGLDIKSAVAQARARLVELQHHDGSWSMLEGQPASPAAAALAMVALSGFQDNALREPLKRGAAWLTPQEGDGAPWVKRFLHRWFPELFAVEANPDLKGWPWVPGTWSWVEPTSYAMLALKRARRDGYAPAEIDDRLAEAERMMFDRMCYGGGWNFGNKKVLGEELPPYPDTTALALIALQDHAGESTMTQSLHALKGITGDNDSGLVAGLTVVCESLYGRDPSRALARLQRSHAKTDFVGDNKVRGLALLASGDHKRWTAVG